MKIKSIEHKDNTVKIIDQTKLPGELVYLEIKDARAMWRAIKELKVRGAPALAAAAALGVYLGIRDCRAATFSAFQEELHKVIVYIGSSRPTARNLFWALERIRHKVQTHGYMSVAQLKRLILEEGHTIIREDQASCRNIARFGAKLIKNNDSVLTVCNAGILATVDYGTALGVLYKANEEGKRFKLYACETRPLLQGARLTTWEAKQKGLDVTLICDNMAATLMQQGKIDKVIAGADRIAANGDTANKIGTYSLAVLARYHKIPFYIAAPLSTFDLSIKTGKDIVIEQRGPQEVSELFFKRRICASGIKVYNPAFDVTANSLITAIISDKGILKPPYVKSIAKIVGGAGFPRPKVMFRAR